MSGIVAHRPATDEHPAVTYRAAGDRCLLVEYGEIALDLELNFFTIATMASLAEHMPPGLVEAAPGFRSLLLNYSPSVISQKTLVGALDELHDAQRPVRSLALAGRRITLPIAFDDSASREAVGRYAAITRPDAPNVQNGSNIEYLVEYNGLDGPQALYDAVLGTDWWTAYNGFFPGLPFLYPLDPRHAITAPRYNPTRRWTAASTVGIGGPCVAIYPVESGGSYQLFGRTVPIYDHLGRHDVFRDDPLLIRPGDRIQFEWVTEEELIHARREVLENRYTYTIRDEVFIVADHLARNAELAGEAARLRANREAAASRMAVP
ncbi:carboxyltransferase domain-containing protein [Amycolatopsis taiwanensis]|uniref:carboxyltransferase domain-containing protein n=1 Tax=Amycolatopsis taiwanensis TaxID=342230 RepID=UPI0004B7D9FA|nr:carboxyltransferase domain-containing protein [Amycolatopsis taiwanensis]